MYNITNAFAPIFVYCCIQDRKIMSYYTVTEWFNVMTSIEETVKYHQGSLYQILHLIVT